MWNESAETLLGFREGAVIGRHCHTVIRGRDELGAYCCDRCPSWRAAIRGSPIPSHHMQIQDAADRHLDVTVLVLRVHGSDGLSLIHLMEPVDMPDVTGRENIDAEIWEPSPTPLAQSTELTFRELDIIHELAVGHDSNAIARRLLISRGKVWDQISSCVRKLQGRA